MIMKFYSIFSINIKYLYHYQNFERSYKGKLVAEKTKKLIIIKLFKVCKTYVYDYEVVLAFWTHKSKTVNSVYLGEITWWRF